MVRIRNNFFAAAKCLLFTSMFTLDAESVKGAAYVAIGLIAKKGRATCMYAGISAY